MPNTNLAPRFRVFFSEDAGRHSELPPGYYDLLQSVEVEASIDGADELVISAWARDPDGPPGKAWRFLGENVMGPGSVVTIEASYADGGAPVTLQRFWLHAEDAEYPANGIPTVTIRGYSAEARLAVYTKARVFKGPITDSQIAHDIALEHGLQVTHDTIELAASRPHGRVKAAGTSDLVFLQQLAIANGYGSPIVRYDAAKKADVLYFRKQRVDKAAALDLCYSPTDAGSASVHGTLLTFSPKLDLHGVPTKVEVTGWDQKAQTAILVIAEITEDGQEPTFLLGPAAVAAAGYKIKSGSQMQARALKSGHEPTKNAKLESVSIPHLRTVEDALDWAKRWIKLRNAAFLTARARTVGIPSLWVGQVHRISGVAPTHAGLWEIVKCKHSFSGGGYTCDLDLERVLEEAAQPKEGAP